MRSEEEGWLSLARSGLVAGATRVEGGGRWKSQHRKIVPLSPYVEKPLNSKVIKSFVPELRSCKCFSRFGIPMFYVYMLWTLYLYFAYPYMAMSQLTDFPPTQDETQGYFIVRGRGHSQIMTHASISQKKNLLSLAFPILGHHRCQAINSALPSSYCLQGKPHESLQSLIM